MKALKTAIIGCGGIAAAHMGQFYSGSEKVEVVACVDQSTDYAARFAKANSIQQIYTSLDALLASGQELDAVDICTPPQYHGQLLLTALRAGKHAVTEKPFAMDISEAEAAVKLAEEKGLKLMVMQNYRWRPEYAEAKGMIDAGHIGKPTLITISSRHDWHAFGAGEYRKKMQRMSIFELSIHYLDLFRFLSGSEVEQVYAAAGRRDDSPFIGDAFSAIVLKFKNGCIGNLVTSAETIGEKANWGAETVIQGTNGTVWLNRDQDYELRAYSRIFGGMLPTSVLSPVNGWFGGPLSNFYDCIVNGTEPPTSGADNLQTLKIVFGAYESVEKGIAAKID
jgi:predicted dehydrogenase